MYTYLYMQLYAQRGLLIWGYPHIIEVMDDNFCIETQGDLWIPNFEVVLPGDVCWFLNTIKHMMIYDLVGKLSLSSSVAPHGK